MIVLVLVGGNGVGAAELAYAPMSTALEENEAKYSPAKFKVSSGFLSSRNWRKSDRRHFSSGCCLMYREWSSSSSSLNDMILCVYSQRVSATVIMHTMLQPMIYICVVIRLVGLNVSYQQ